VSLKFRDPDRDDDLTPAPHGNNLSFGQQSGTSTRTRQDNTFIKRGDNYGFDQTHFAGNWRRGGGSGRGAARVRG